MEQRARARQLASEYLAKGDPTAWFEQLYREAEEGKSKIPWADYQPNPNLTGFWEAHAIPSAGKNAVTVGCGLGDDAEQIARWGFRTTAFDISQSAIQACKRRFPGSEVDYVAADLLGPPPQWIQHFDFVVESYTLQVLPQYLRRPAMKHLSDLVREQGYLLVVSRGREEHEPAGQMPWPLIRSELDSLEEFGLRTIEFEDYMDRESPPVRRFRGLYQKAEIRKC